MQIFLLIALLISIIAILFAVQNNATTTVSFLFWETQGSLALVLLIAIAAGALISFLVSLPSNIKSRLTIRNLRKQIKDLETDIAEHRQKLEDIQNKDDQSTSEKPNTEQNDPLI